MVCTDIIIVEAALCTICVVYACVHYAASGVCVCVCVHVWYKTMGIHVTLISSSSLNDKGMPYTYV